MPKIQIPSDVIQSSSEAQVRRAAANFAESISAYLGNPITGEITVASSDKKGLVFIYGLGSEPASVFTATNIGLNKIDMYLGAPILVTRKVNGYTVTGKNPDTAPDFFEGADARNDQTPIYMSQFYYGTMHPHGSSLQLLIIGAQYDDDDVVDLITDDFATETVQDTSLANITLPTVINTAKGILVQLDPTTETLSYKQSSTYAATIKPRQAYRAGLLPATDTGLFRIGYFNLTYGITTFTYGDIWSCPEFIGGGSSAPIDATYIVQTPNADLTNEQALSALATGLLGVTTTTGVISTGGNTGATDNAVLRADGTGGKTVQSSSATINDNGRLHLPVSADSDALWIKQHSSQTVDPVIITDFDENDQIRFLADGGAVFNEEGNDVDFRIETNNNANAFFVDGGNDNAGFGTGTPDAALLVDLVSTAKALGLPTMTTTQRDTIASPPNRAVIYNSTTHTIDARINGAWVALNAGISLPLAIGSGGTGQTTQTAAYDALSPNTTKGDIAVYNGSDNVRLPVGTNDFVLTADSTQAAGVKWAASSGAPFVDSTAIIKGSADATKLLRLEVDGFTTATTRVLTPPNYDGTIATLAGTETFTNKTLDADGTGNVITNIGSSEVKAELITGLSADATPDGAADYVMTYDASATALKKVLLDNLPISVTVASDNYVFNDGADWTTNNTSFVDIDGTDMSIDITTTGNPVEVGFHGTFAANAALNLFLDFTVDGSIHGGDSGICKQTISAATTFYTVSFSRIVTGLSAASHNFKMQWRVSTNTVTLYAGAGTATNDLHGQFWAQEIS